MSDRVDLTPRSHGAIDDAGGVEKHTSLPPPLNGVAKYSGGIVPSKTESLAAGMLDLKQIRRLNLQIPEGSPILPFGNNQRHSSEQYRILRTKLTHHRKQARLIVISSPESGDGKSVSAINTAGAIALKSEGQVLLVDADLRRSAVHEKLGIPGSPGLSDVLSGACGLERALVQIAEFPNLFVLPSGTPSDNPVELLDSSYWIHLCAQLREIFRYVIVDSPPVCAVADYELIQSASDGVVIVVRPDFTNRRLFKKAFDFVPKAKLLGVLLNCVPEWAAAKQAGADYYYYASDKESAPSRVQPVDSER